MKEARKIILFDMMDTLLREPYYDALQHLLPCQEDRRLFLEWKNTRSFHDFERAQISEKEHLRSFYKQSIPKEIESRLPKAKKIKKTLLRKLSYRAGMEELLKEAQTKPNIYTGLASNYSEWYALILESMPLLKQCDYLFFSCELGYRKPEKAYYETIFYALKSRAEHASLQAKDLLFIDDRSVNLKSAQKLGWQVHLMQNSYEARKAIKAFCNDPAA